MRERCMGELIIDIWYASFFMKEGIKQAGTLDVIMTILMIGWRCMFSFGFDWDERYHGILARCIVLFRFTSWKKKKEYFIETKEM